MEKEMITIENKSDGSKLNVELITYLISDDQQSKYIVYSKGEVTGAEGDEIIYISRISKNGETLIVEEILDDNEWMNVQTLLKKIANAQ
jgi:hypothetical protein